MRKIILFLLTLCLCVTACFGTALGEDAAAPENPPAAAATTEEAPVVRQHTAVVQGQTLNYTTTTGIMNVNTVGGACEIFYMAYTLDGVEDVSQRPITFAFNGGPGSCSALVQMGFLSPRRPALDENGQANSFPVPLEDNNYSILDLTDLVFIDPVGCGYSKPAEGADLKEFVGYENDLRSVGDFIRQYINRNGRWLSPKYVAGESYGTTRAVGLAQYLGDTYSLNLNGIMLVSCFLNATVIMDVENPSDLAYVLSLPTYVADAWYHKKLDEKHQKMELEDLMKEARAFAGGEYLSALFRGKNLDEKELDEIATRMAALTGLDKEQIIKANLRIELPDFCKSLLADQKLVIGRYDGRYTGPLTGGSISDGAADPSDMAIDGIFQAAVNHYINEELDYHTDRPYVPLSYDVNNLWTFPEEFGNGFSMWSTIHDVMSKNSFLKVWTLCGYYDLATPFYSAEWNFNHVFLNPENEKNLQITHYPSGHMIYLYEPALAQFRKDAEAWFRGN